MKAVVLKEKELVVQEKDPPPLRDDGVLIELIIAPILSYTDKVVDGTLAYLLPKEEFVFGSDLIGRVKAVGKNVFDLKVGTLVYACSHVSSRGNFRENDEILIGLTGMNKNSYRIQNIWRDGAFAEIAHYPIDCITSLEEVASMDIKKLSSIMYMAVPYGGLLSLELKPSESLIIGGATGNFGAFGILIALAMGASKIIPIGRNKNILESYKVLSPHRIFPIVLSGDVKSDTENIYKVTGDGLDCYLDITGGGDTSGVLSAIRALKMGGRVTLMGGLEEPIALPYVEIMTKRLVIKGNFMYPSYAPANIVKMIQSGMINLDMIDVEIFQLQNIQEAVKSASTKKAFSYAAITL